MKSTTNFYLFGSRIATHCVFWVLYYLLFGLLWVGEEGYLASFYLEFILLPTRILAVYITIYFLLPRFLLKRKYRSFFIGYGLTLLLGGILQRVFIHLFYEELLLNDSTSGLFSVMMLVRAIVLINTTVLLVLGAKLFQLWAIEQEKNKSLESEILEIRSNRKTHRVPVDSILFVEGLGNYVTYHLADKSKITSYGSIKATLAQLPPNFRRVHKSYIVNKEHIKSYDTLTIDLQDTTIPRGKSIADDVLLN
ncbi:LytR/AlgR family response regulator transcription factor [Flagellimonas myxillae]|uniref:LytR/AlgR family response regulator transcription factor n=1 Tax=Flagellimonas myxillae TaxID=2942214 RepID=UPI00201F183C|nr:LytTR family DNA-binding domain-containing protein [Muricauda myxillae]MCL6267400.1 LytTR family transcriptional regulator [Muricauda myxillae]